jgi:hypothetical protein
MDSKSTDGTPEANIYVSSNVWTTPNGSEPFAWEAVEFVPGDLRVTFSDASGDQRQIRRVLNERQQAELEAYKFWLPFAEKIQPYELPLHRNSDDGSG